MRKLIIAIVVLVVLVAALVLVLPHIVDVNQYRGQIQAELQNRLNRSVQLGNMSLSVIPLAVEIDQVSIGDDPSFHSNLPFAQAQRLDVHVKLFPLLAKNVEIESLTLERPKIELIRNAAGVWNFASLGHNATAPQSNQAAPKQPAQPSPAAQTGSSSGGVRTGRAGDQGRADRCHRLSKTPGTGDLRSHRPGAERLRTQPAVLAGSHRALAGQGRGDAEVVWNSGPINDAQMLNTPFKGTLKFNEVSLAGAQKFLNTQLLENSDAIISGSTWTFPTRGARLRPRGR